MSRLSKSWYRVWQRESADGSSFLKIVVNDFVTINRLIGRSVRRYVPHVLEKAQPACTREAPVTKKERPYVHLSLKGLSF